MFLSIIIPAYNSEQTIIRCLESCSSQDISIDEYEIIIIDDGSKDNTSRICRKYALEHHNVIYIRQTNRGPASARNHGLHVAKGDYVWFVDSDDYIRVNCLYSLACLFKNDDLDVVSLLWQRVGHGRIISNELGELPLAYEGVVSGEFFLNEINGNSLFTFCFISRRKMIIDNHIFFDETMSMCEDAVFNVRLLCASRTVKIYSVPIYFYCISELSLSNKLSMRQIENVFQYLSFLRKKEYRFALTKFSEKAYSLNIIHMILVAVRMKSRECEKNVLGMIQNLGVTRLKARVEKYTLLILLYNISPHLLFFLLNCVVSINDMFKIYKSNE